MPAETENPKIESGQIWINEKREDGRASFAMLIGYPEGGVLHEDGGKWKCRALKKNGEYIRLDNRAEQNEYFLKSEKEIRNLHLAAAPGAFWHDPDDARQCVRIKTFNINTIKGYGAASCGPTSYSSIDRHNGPNITLDIFCELRGEGKYKKHGGEVFLVDGVHYRAQNREHYFRGDDLPKFKQEYKNLDELFDMLDEKFRHLRDLPLDDEGRPVGSLWQNIHDPAAVAKVVEIEKDKGGNIRYWQMEFLGDGEYQGEVENFYGWEFEENYRRIESLAVDFNPKIRSAKNVHGTDRHNIPIVIHDFRPSKACSFQGDYHDRVLEIVKLYTDKEQKKSKKSKLRIGTTIKWRADPTQIPTKDVELCVDCLDYDSGTSGFGRLLDNEDMAELPREFANADEFMDMIKRVRIDRKELISAPPPRATTLQLELFA